MLVSSRCGVIRRVARRDLPEGFPTALRYWVAELAETRTWGWTSDAAGVGCTWWDDAAAREAAVGEAVERLCGSLTPGAVVRGSARALERSGLRRVDPGSFALFAPQQYASPGFPFVPFTVDLEVNWIWGWSFRDEAPVLVPASIVLTGYALGGNPGSREPLTHPPICAGIAAGPEFEATLEVALLEIVERDSVWRAWAEGGTTIRRRAVPPWLAEVACGSAGRFELELFSFPNEFGLAVAGALVTDRATRVRLLGTACRMTWAQASMKATAEAFQLLAIAVQMLDPHAPIHQAAADAGTLKPWRPARDYRAAYRADWRDVRDQLCHIQLYLDPSMGPLLDAQLAAARTSPVAGDEFGAVGVPLAARMLRRGFDVIAVEVTTEDARAAGFRVVRGVVPGMYSNTPAAFPFLGGRRLRWSGTPVPPLPYA